MNNSTFFSTAEPSTGYIYCHVVLNSVLLLVTCVGNLLTIVSIQRKRTLTHKVTNRLVLNLACADLLVGLTAPLHAGLFAIEDAHTFRVFCLVQDSMASVATGMSLYSLLLIAVERYMGICHPLQRQRWLTLHRIRFSIIATWIYITTTVAIVYSFQVLDEGMPCLMSFFLPVWVYEGMVSANVVFVIVICFSLYGRIFYIAKTSHSKVVLYRSVSLRSNPTAAPLDNGIHSNRDKKPWQQAMKVNVVMVIVMGAFVITWVPFMVTSSLRLGLNRTTPQWIMAEETLMVMAAMNSSLNPFIYAWKFRDFRWAYRKAILSPIIRLRGMGGRDAS